jgi:hypothetical protein
VKPCLATTDMKVMVVTLGLVHAMESERVCDAEFASSEASCYLQDLIASCTAAIGISKCAN